MRKNMLLLYETLWKDGSGYLFEMKSDLIWEIIHDGINGE